MTAPPSPYAPPAVPLSLAAGVYIEGSKLVVPDGYIFPPICPFTGEVTGLGMATTRRVSAHEKWVYVLLLAGLLPYVFVAMILSSKATFNCRLSESVTRRWRFYRIIGTITFFGSFFIFFAGASRSSIELSFLALVMLVGGLCTACGLFDGIKASAVKDGKIWLLGMPHAVRERIVQIEQKRVESVARAAHAHALQQQEKQLAASLGTAPGESASPFQVHQQQAVPPPLPPAALVTTATPPPLLFPTAATGAH